jgi:hypothetical protein
MQMPFLHFLQGLEGPIEMGYRSLGPFLGSGACQPAGGEGVLGGFQFLLQGGLLDFPDLAFLIEEPLLMAMIRAQLIDNLH